MAAKAEPPAQPGRTILAVYASAELPNGDWVSLTPGLQVGETAYYAGDHIPVGPSADLSVLGTALYGSGSNCQRGVQFLFKSWMTYPSYYYDPGVYYPVSPVSYETTHVYAYGIHDVPNHDVDQVVLLTYDAACL